MLRLVPHLALAVKRSPLSTKSLDAQGNLEQLTLQSCDELMQAVQLRRLKFPRSLIIPSHQLLTATKNVGPVQKCPDLSLKEVL